MNDNGLKKFNKWLGLVLSLVAVMSMLIGAVAGMTIKSQRIDEAYRCAKENEKSIQDLREVVIRIDENLKFIRAEIEGMKKR